MLGDMSEGGQDYKELQRNSGVDGNIILTFLMNTCIKNSQTVHFKYEQVSINISINQ